jgi:hypothetical protein
LDREFQSSLIESTLQLVVGAEKTFRAKGMIPPFAYVSRTLPGYDFTSSTPWISKSQSSADASRVAALQEKLKSAQPKRLAGTTPQILVASQNQTVADLPMTVQEVTRLTDTSISSVKKFLAFVILQKTLYAHRFDYRRYLSADLLISEPNTLLSTALYTFQMAPELCTGWGERDFDIEKFLEEYLRIASAGGSVPNEALAKEKFRQKLHPLLLKYHPGENMWNAVFDAFIAVAKTYGSDFDDSVAINVNLWANVKNFWKLLIADKKCSAALHALVTSLLVEWEKNIQEEEG